MNGDLGNLEDSYTSTWTDIGVVKMKTFVRILFFIKIIYGPTIPLYWSTDKFSYTPMYSSARLEIDLKLC